MTGPAAEYVVAVDSGGTFSDCVIVDATGRVTTGKAPSTPEDFSAGVLDSIESAAAELGLTAADVLTRAILFAHGTTVATNALLERKGSPSGLITTAGHEDAILIGRTFQKVAGLTEDEITQVARLRKPDPVIARPMIAGVHERVDAKGDVVVPLNMDSVERAVGRLLERGAESIGVSLLWSFLNPAHERAIGDYLRDRHPDLPVTLSSDLAPVIREYERGMTVAINAYLVAGTGRYLGRLADRIEAAGYTGQPVVMQSSGGVTSIARARDRAVNLITSGPAGGTDFSSLAGIPARDTEQVKEIVSERGDARPSVEEKREVHAVTGRLHEGDGDQWKPDAFACVRLDLMEVDRVVEGLIHGRRYSRRRGRWVSAL